MIGDISSVATRFTATNLGPERVVGYLGGETLHFLDVGVSENGFAGMALKDDVDEVLIVTSGCGNEFDVVNINIFWFVIDVESLIF